ncbi:MAG TPA: asparagine synthase (glutamine-hydrolyzing) [Thermoanaerobaculia bacterium]|nr:asparagine synthase (glutamine-hydrolyzing) [Thermoanaerobaculia bacterium]
MCGIVVIHAFASDASSVDEQELLTIRDCMTSRGPDGCGMWMSADRRTAMAHRRLAIIDPTPRAAQPMTSRDGRFTIVFNGEIYNHHELRGDVERDSGPLRTTSDTEVLLALYARDGEAMLRKLRGMFAICIWDASKRTLFLARDPYGIKPLYYAVQDGTIRVASQVRALLAGRASRGVDLAGLTGFLLRGSVPEPFTMHEGIRAVPSGSSILVDEHGAGQPKTFFSVARAWAEAARAQPASDDETREEIRESVRYHMVADVEVGAFLSSGKDSTSITAIAQELTPHPLRTVTLAFDEYRGTRHDEAPLAEQVAHRYGFHHETRVLGREEFLRELPRMRAAMDQPTIDAFNSYFVSRAAAAHGLKVVLSGTGGDELFGGYTTFSKIPRFVRSMAVPSRLPLLPRAFRELHRALIRSNPKFSPKSGSSLEYGGTYAGAYLIKRGLFLPWELPAIIGLEAANEGLDRLGMIEQFEEALADDPGSGWARVAILESVFLLRDQLLRDIDWAAMAHSLEVRVPLVDIFLLKAIAPTVLRARGDRKRLLVSAPKHPLPPEVFQRRKSGFTLPVKKWMNTERRRFGMRDWALELLREEFLPRANEVQLSRTIEAAAVV